MTARQEQARALGDPTRFAIFEHLTAADDPVDVAELTELLGLHHNAIRQHLAKLVAAGLVIQTTAAPSGRGRPRLLYAVDPTSDATWGEVGPFERLSLLLVEVIRSGDTPVEVGRRAGQRWRLGKTGGDDPVAVLVDQMTRLGFAPIDRRDGDTADITLQQCPFAAAVLADADVVCSLHLGLAQGLADSAGGIEVDELVVKDPRRAGCRLRCTLDQERVPSM